MFSLAKELSVKSFIRACAGLLVLGATACVVLAQAKQDPKTDPIKISAEQLTKECATDDNKANDKYRDKIVEVDGVVKKSDKQGNTGGWSIELTGTKYKDGKSTWTVMAVFDAKSGDLGTVKKLKAGDKVVIRGKFLVSLGALVQVREPVLVK